MRNGEKRSKILMMSWRSFVLSYKISIVPENGYQNSWSTKQYQISCKEILFKQLDGTFFRVTSYEYGCAEKKVSRKLSRTICIRWKMFEIVG